MSEWRHFSQLERLTRGFSNGFLSVEECSIRGTHSVEECLSCVTLSLEECLDCGTLFVEECCEWVDISLVRGRDILSI